VFKLNRANGAGAVAVRCFRGFLGDREERYHRISHHLGKVSAPSLVGFEYDPLGITVLGRKYPILKMEWVNGLPLDVYAGEVFQRGELPELWTEFHDENLIFTKKDFQAPSTSSLFAKLKKLRSVQQLVGVLEKACRQDPLDCPCILDLVTR